MEVSATLLGNARIQSVYTARVSANEANDTHALMNLTKSTISTTRNFENE